MRRRTGSRLGWAIGLFALAVVAVGLFFGVKNGAELWSYDSASAVVLVGTFGGLGGLLASRRPANPIGWIFVATSVMFAVSALADQYSRFGLVTSPGAVSGADVAVAFQPVRERARRFANRLVYGKRVNPYEVLSQFSERMGGAYDARDILPRMSRILGEGTGARRAERSEERRVGKECRSRWSPDH